MTTYTTSPTETLRLGDVVVLGVSKYTVTKCGFCEYYQLMDDHIGVLGGETCTLESLTKFVCQEFAKFAPKKLPKFAVGQVWEGPNGHRMRIDEISPGLIVVHIVHSPDGKCQYEWTKWELDGSGLFAGRKKDDLSLTKLIADAPAPEKAPTNDEVKLVLSKEEAQFLRSLIGQFVCGIGPSRKIGDAIHEKLIQAGVMLVDQKHFNLSFAKRNGIAGIWCDEAKEPLFRTNEVWRTEKKYLVRVCMVRSDGAAFVRTIHNTNDAAIIYGDERTREVSADGVIVASGDKLIEKISD